MIKRNLTLFILIGLLSCGQKQSTYQSLKKELVPTNDLLLSLDNVTAANSRHIKHFSDSGIDYLSLFNTPDGQIKIFSLESNEIIKSIKINSTGPNAIPGVGGSSVSFQPKTLDQFYVFSTAKEALYLIDSEGIILNEWSVPNFNSNPKGLILSLNSLNGFYEDEENFIVVGQAPWYKDALSPIQLVSKNKSLIREIDPSLDIYENFKLDEIGNSNFFYASTTRLKNGNVLISYPLEHNVIVVDEKLKTSTLQMKNENIGELESFGEPLNAGNMNSQKYFDFQGTAPIYHSIFFDEYNDVIYRIGRNRFPQSELEKVRAGGEKKSWDFSIYIYDTDYNLIGISTIENTIGYNFANIFVSEKGLHIQKISQDEDILQFARYELKDL